MHRHVGVRLPRVFNGIRIRATNLDVCANSDLMIDEFSKLEELKRLSIVPITVSFETLSDKVHLTWVLLQDLLDVDSGMVDYRG